MSTIAQPTISAETTARASVSVIDSAGADCPNLPLVVGAGRATAVLWPGVGAVHRSMTHIALGEGARTVPLRHDGESVYYVIAGRGVVLDLDGGGETALAEGAMVHIGQGDGYAFRAEPGAAFTIVGGPCPADPAFYRDIHSHPDTQA